MHRSEHYELALELARRGIRGANPLVGCVIVGPGGDVISTGYHRGRGSAHAEVDAISHAPAGSLQGATAIVTLEPCSHTGRTGPCTEAIIASGISRVEFAVSDPNPTAANGADRLREAGIEVDPWPAEFQPEAEELNRRWLDAQRFGRPFVTAKIAQTIDGFGAAPDGTSQWITGEAAREHSHELRARVDAIAVGTGTVLADDPRLTARPAGAPEQSAPLRVAIGLRDIPDSAQIRGTDSNFIHLRTHQLDEALTQLKSYGVDHLLIDGGPTVVGAALAANLVDELLVYVAPTILGRGRTSVAGLNTRTLADRLDLAPVGAPRQLGADLLMTFQPKEKVCLPE